MKHDIHEEMYFSELDNYKFMTCVDTFFDKWILSNYNQDQIWGRRQFDAPCPPSGIMLDNRFLCFQEYIDNKSILLCAEEAALYPNCLFPINYISSNDDCEKRFRIRLKIFYNSDMISFITKQKLIF